MAGFDALDGFAYPVLAEAFLLHQELHQPSLIRWCPRQLGQLISYQHAGLCIQIASSWCVAYFLKCTSPVSSGRVHVSLGS